MRHEVMRNESHATLIGILLGHVNAWRKREGWSRETVVQCIVEAHERIGGPGATDIRFDSCMPDQFQRMKNNADRVFRWLDDQTKDTNLLPANFLPSILAAMPADQRQHCADDVLRVCGLATRSLQEAGHQALDAVHMLQSCMKEGAEANQAMAALIDGASEQELQDAQREITEAIEALQIARTKVEIRLKHGGAPA